MKDIWRNLFVKCYKFIFPIILFFSLSVYSQDSTVDLINLAKAELESKTHEKIKPEKIVILTTSSVLPINDSNIQNGEIYKVSIESDKSKEEILTYKNRMINEVMYVMEVISDGEELYFKVFVTDPPKKKKKGKKIFFEMSAFNYKPVKKESGADFFSFEMPFELKDSKSYLVIGIISFFILMISIPLGWFLWKFLTTSKKRRNRKKINIGIAKDLIEILKIATEREDFEKIYKERRKIKELVELNEITFSNFLAELDILQYKKNWSTTELEKIQKKFNALDDFRIARGI